MRKFVGTVLTLLVSCELAACDSLWGTFYQCKTGMMCDIPDGNINPQDASVDMTATLSTVNWASDEFNNWVDMSLVPGGTSLLLLSSSGPMGLVPFIATDPNAFTVIPITSIISSEPFKSISACEPLGNELTALVIGDQVSYRVWGIGLTNSRASIGTLTLPRKYNAVTCKRDKNSTVKFAYISGSPSPISMLVDEPDFISRNAADFMPLRNNLGATIDVISAVPEIGSSDFWAIDSDRRVINYDGKTGTLAPYNGATLSGSGKIISAINSSDAFYVADNGNLVTATKSKNSLWTPPPGIQIVNIFTVDTTQVWVALSNRTIAEMVVLTSSNGQLNFYNGPSSGAIKKIAVSRLPDRTRLVYVLTVDGRLLRAIIP